MRRFWGYTRGDRRKLVLGGLGTLIVAGCELATVALFDMMTNRVLARGHLAGFWGPAAWWLGVVSVAAVAMFFGEYLSTLAAERFALRLRDDVFAHAQRLPPDYFDRQQQGDLMVRLTGDVATIEGVAASGVAGLVTSAISAALFAAAAFLLSWRLAIVSCAVTPVFWLASRGFSAKFQRAAELERELTGRLTNTIEESLSNQALIQAFNQQTGEFRRLHAEGASWLGARMRQVRLGAVYAPFIYVVETVCVLTVFGFGAWQVSTGALTLGGLLAFAVLLAYLYSPVQGISGYRLAKSEAAESVARVTEILDAEPPVSDGTAIRAGLRSRGTVAFDDVWFGYEGPPVLRGLSFVATPGHPMAVVGPSGSGKSTIAKLLLRFYDPDAGRVLLDGVDIKDMSLRALRHNITLLSQENLLFTGTIGENIGYGRRGATSSDIVTAARRAGAHEFITGLPEGYDTQVRGRLSGGQRQRIAIARAILRDSPLLVLDEPTAGLSQADARRVMGLLAPVIENRTTIVITHDLAIAAEADEVVRLGSRPVAAAVGA
ncbi:MAG: ABC transporter ATP-binding protein [Streptosporangiaceae bacterium]|jgi:ATP-binding cassette subfamily B protein